MSNEYYWHGRVSERKFLQLVRCFVDDKTAKSTAEETKLDRKSVNGIFMKIRRRLLKEYSRKKLGFSIKDLKTSSPYFIAESEADCKKYARNYKLNILIILFDDRSYSSHMIYGATDKVFDEILKNINSLKETKIEHCSFTEMDEKTRPINFGPKMRLAKTPHAYLAEPGLLRERSEWLLSYFFYRTKKFKGINSNNFILHMKETEWRANKIPRDKEIVKQIQDSAELARLHTQCLYDDLIGVLKQNSL